MAIEFSNVSKVFGIGTPLEKCALNDVSLTIEKGDFIGIAGHNGSGKSTLVRMINGLMLPSFGAVYIDGMNTADRKTITRLRSLVGMLFQNPDNQIISPIIEEDVAFGPSNLGLSPAEVKQRTDWALEVLGLEQLRHHSPHLLSGGQKQKVAIASALAMRPSYLVLDEPTSMLDTSSRLELIATLKSLNQDLGITIVLISHYMEDMVAANRLIVLDQGKKYLDEAPDVLFSLPQSLNDIGISPPEIACLMNRLRSQGHQLDQKLMTINQVEEYVCQLLR